LCRFTSRSPQRRAARQPLDRRGLSGRILKGLIVQNRTRCEEFTPAPQCWALLRISDESGRPIQGARFDTKVPVGPGSGVSDPLGRLFLSIKRMERFDGAVVKEGFEPTPFSEQCWDDLEPKIVLRQR